jgi:S-adenosylmethionine/arginine decarboxylase-like enzyme
MVIHHHTIIVATVRKKSAEINCEDLSFFLSKLVREIGMKKLFKPIAIHGKYGFTGIVGIVTSHIAFHYFDQGQILHFDVYSCKNYNIKTLVNFIDKYWGMKKADILFVNRDKLFSIKKYHFLAGKLVKRGYEKNH